jgi:hypothetical protein
MEILNVQPDTMEWRVYRNDSTVLTLVMVDPDDVAIDLGGWTFTGVVRQFPTSIEALSVFDIQKNENFLTMTLDTNQLDTISYFDIQGTNNLTGKVITVLRGQIYVEEDVTR